MNVSSAATVFNHYPLHKQRPELRRTHYIRSQLALKLHFKVCDVRSVITRWYRRKNSLYQRYKFVEASMIDLWPIIEWW